MVYEFEIEVDKKVLPIKLVDAVSRWDFVDHPILLAAAAEGRRPDAGVLPVWPPFQFAGPMKLWIQDGDDVRLALPHDVESSVLKKIILSDGAVVIVKDAKSISLRHPLDLPLPLNCTHQKGRSTALSLLTIAEALRHASCSNRKPLLSILIVGPTSLTSTPSKHPNGKLKLKYLAPGLAELSSHSVRDISENVEGSDGTTLWPMTSLNGSDLNLQGLEKLLASVLGKKGSKEGSFRLLKAQVSAQFDVKMGFAVEKRLRDAEVDCSRFPEWKTKPERATVHFEVLGRIDDSGKVIPERITEVPPFETQEVIVGSLKTENVSMSRLPIIPQQPNYFTL
ncbi:hypothetical protein COCNU_06G019280 [Cocos nucifera]|uniref:Uncharacterized protein n=1 Tax=Cocos nucifera TaxID=13894 RepID=A0A8K0N430_COCNU|nr:hypothetical protein COCNU_06G019280 [Cocos nucifera]